MNKKINIRNKKASFNYEFIDKYTAGIVLTGTEIKSIREGKISFTDSYCRFINNELWLIGIHIAEYTYGSYNNHSPKRYHKLLLNRKELQKIEKKNYRKRVNYCACSFICKRAWLCKGCNCHC